MYDYYAIMYRNRRKPGVAVESTCYFAENEEAAKKQLKIDLHRQDRAYNIEVLSVVKIED